tara:strand:- start:5108 stop:5401 length:294 start_codon:yes stop_codon:yes gene_type:complete
MSKNSSLFDFFKMFFAGTLGSIAAIALVSLFSLAFFITGFLLIKNYNKKDTKPLEELQLEQYGGIVLCAIGLIPWLRYLFMGFGFEAGSFLFNELME